VSADHSLLGLPGLGVIPTIRASVIVGSFLTAGVHYRGRLL